jgi:hypothetical protein
MVSPAFFAAPEAETLRTIRDARSYMLRLSTIGSRTLRRAGPAVAEV